MLAYGEGKLKKEEEEEVVEDEEEEVEVHAGGVEGRRAEPDPASCVSRVSS